MYHTTRSSVSIIENPDDEMLLDTAASYDVCLRNRWTLRGPCNPGNFVLGQTRVEKQLEQGHYIGNAELIVTVLDVVRKETGGCNCLHSAKSKHANVLQRSTRSEIQHGKLVVVSHEDLLAATEKNGRTDTTN